MTTAWGSILQLLSVVPQAEEAETVNLAFQSVQLLCSDYMSSLPVNHLRRCVEVAALYGSQQVRQRQKTGLSVSSQSSGSLDRAHMLMHNASECVCVSSPWCEAHL